jgi:hypothetical protein
MIPWIRSWGADCEVLEPKKLKMSVIRDVKRMARIYELESYVETNNDDYDDKRFTSLFKD